jgi:hypothetical protein
MNRKKQAREQRDLAERILSEYGVRGWSWRITGTNHSQLRFEHNGCRRQVVVGPSGDWRARRAVEAHLRRILESREQ